ncbi:MAG: oligosaccharide flippase family protein [Methylococcales bacterium]
MSLRKNIFANYLGVIGTALAPVLALPWYLNILGPKQFGLISFVVMFQSLLTLIDAGMSQALVREIAIRFDTSSNDQRSTGLLLFGFERVYWLFAIVIGSLAVCFAGIIAKYWINLDGLPFDSGKEAIYGAAAIFACQFPGSIYRSLLVGTQKQVTLNSLMLIFTLIRHVGGVLVLMKWPMLFTYLFWQAVIAFVESLVRGWFAWGAIGVKRNQCVWSTTELRLVWRLVASLSGVTFLGAFTLQMDRIFLSRMVNIEQLGYYAIAATVATGVLQLISPLMQAILPKAIQLRTNSIALYRLNIKLMGVLMLFVVLGVLAYMTLGQWILTLWLRTPETVTEVYPLLTVLLIGTGMNALCNVGYMNWIIHEKINRVFQVNALSFILSITLIPYFITTQGTIGAAFGWLTINSISLVLSSEWVKNRL